MERRELWAWLAGGAVALGTLGLGVVGLMADAQPLAYWSTVAVLAACFVFGGVVLYLLNRHRFFGASLDDGFRAILEEPLPPDESGMPGWMMWLMVTRRCPAAVRIVADDAIYQVGGRSERHGDDPGHAAGRQFLRANVVVLDFSGGPLLPEEVLVIEVRSVTPLRVVSVKPYRSPFYPS